MGSTCFCLAASPLSAGLSRAAADIHGVSEDEIVEEDCGASRIDPFRSELRFRHPADVLDEEAGGKFASSS